MKIATYKELIQAYKGYYDLSESCLPKRSEILKTNPYSVILEATHYEFDSLDEWIKINLPDSNIEFLYYSKTDYDYAEYFGKIEKNVIELKKVIPNIYTIFLDSSMPDGSKTNGSGNWIEYSSEDSNGIVIRINEN